jgi:DNA-binding response OmpR family regulator
MRRSGIMETSAVRTSSLNCGEGIDQREREHTAMDGTRHILIVDDDTELAGLLARAVGAMSDAYQVRIAEDVDEAMVLVRRLQNAGRAFDLVITDVKMAGLSGLELLEALGSITPQTKTIAMTAYDSSELAKHAQELNVYAYLTKPFIISRFRDTVRAAIDLAESESEVQEQKPASAVSAAQQAAIKEQLAFMRTMTGAMAALLIQAGGRLLAVDSHGHEDSLEVLCSALMSAQTSVGEHIAQALHCESPIRQMYFGTEELNICLYRLDETHFVAVVFGPEVKEGQVWYYMRESAEDLTEAMRATARAAPAPRQTVRDDVMEMLDHFLPRQQERASTQRRAQSEPQASAPGSAEKQPQHLSERELAALDDIDWDIPPQTDWDALVAETDRPFQGLRLEEAKAQGLVSQDLDQAPAAEPEAAALEPADQAALDNIDWDAATEADWEAFVADADQGFKGISLDEAQDRGLVGDVAEE